MSIAARREFMRLGRAGLAIAVSLIFALPSRGDQVVVKSTDPVLEKSLEVGPNEAAALTVLLKSSGEPLNGVRVSLRRLASRAKPAEATSDVLGVVRFPTVAPGHYAVALKRTPKVGDSVAISDFELRYLRERYKRAKDASASTTP